MHSQNHPLSYYQLYYVKKKRKVLKRSFKVVIKRQKLMEGVGGHKKKKYANEYLREVRIMSISSERSEVSMVLLVTR